MVMSEELLMDQVTGSTKGQVTRSLLRFRSRGHYKGSGHGVTAKVEVTRSLLRVRSRGHC